MQRDCNLRRHTLRDGHDASTVLQASGCDAVTCVHAVQCRTAAAAASESKQLLTHVQIAEGTLHALDEHVCFSPYFQACIFHKAFDIPAAMKQQQQLVQVHVALAQQLAHCYGCA
jgi:hypothetical protein